ncbi:unnamed protein product [Polarella glacialis]|uniref:Uncharacterized protein n=1 Tax=Polarella glacialis TaxID=89957 RepID=A0A813GPB8_POLGL|nr:unnamed protein product [Polarella glacialis]
MSVAAFFPSLLVHQPWALQRSPSHNFPVLQTPKAGRSTLLLPTQRFNGRAKRAREVAALLLEISGLLHEAWLAHSDLGFFLPEEFQSRPGGDEDNAEASWAGAVLAWATEEARRVSGGGRSAISPPRRGSGKASLGASAAEQLLNCLHQCLTLPGRAGNSTDGPGRSAVAAAASRLFHELKEAGSQIVLRTRWPIWLLLRLVVVRCTDAPDAPAFEENGALTDRAAQYRWRNRYV